MQLIDGLKQALDFVAGFVEVVLNNAGEFVSALDLGVEILDCLL